MRLAVFQFAPVFGDPSANLGRIASAVRGTAADLWVLPELCTTGYLFESRDECRSLAEPIPGPATEALAALCRERSTRIVAGLAERAGDRTFNVAALVGSGGVEAVYRKVHLFDRETVVFDPGPGPFAVHDVGHHRIGMMVCFDWIFPEAARSLALLGADLIVHPSNLVLPYCPDAMVTRSIENGVFTATANRVGVEERGGRRLAFIGRSQITDPRGGVLVRAGDAAEETIVADVDLRAARDKAITDRNDRLGDRRPECYVSKRPTD